MRRGTRLLNAALPPDPDCIKYLQREFGREILSKSPWKVLPRNKKLKLHELTSLFRYHYSRTLGKERVFDDNWWRGLKRWEMHRRRLDDFRSMLIRCGFHGYGNPQDDNGIVVFAGDCLTPAEVIAEVPSDGSGRYGVVDPAGFAGLDQLKDVFRRSGSERARRLADLVAGREPDAGI